MTQDGESVWLPARGCEVLMAVHLDVELAGLRVRFSGPDLIAAWSRGLFLPYTRILGVGR